MPEFKTATYSEDIFSDSKYLFSSRAGTEFGRKIVQMQGTKKCKTGATFWL